MDSVDRDEVLRWRSVILEASAEKRRALEIGAREGLDRLPFWQAVDRGHEWRSDQFERRVLVGRPFAEKAAAALRRRGVDVGLFVAGTKRDFAYLIFGVRKVFTAIKPFDGDVMVTSHYNLELSGAQGKAFSMAALLANAADVPPSVEDEQLTSAARLLAEAWRDFSEERMRLEAMKGEIRLSRLIEAAYQTAWKAILELSRIRFSNARWPRASALLEAAYAVFAAIGGMHHRPATKENALRCLEMLLWLRDLEKKAADDLAEIDLLRAIGETWFEDGNGGVQERSHPWSLLNGVPDSVRKKWLSKARERAARFGVSGRGA